MRPTNRSRFVAAEAVSSYSFNPERRMESNKITRGVNDNRHSVDDDDNDGDEETVYVIAYNEEEPDRSMKKGRNTDGKDSCRFRTEITTRKQRHGDYPRLIMNRRVSQVRIVPVITILRRFCVICAKFLPFSCPPVFPSCFSLSNRAAFFILDASPASTLGLQENQVHNIFLSTRDL